jgi:hypothetical protein
MPLGPHTSRQQGSEGLDLGVEVTSASAPFHRTRIVRFAPRYWVVNALPFALQLRQRGSDRRTCIAAQSTCEVHRERTDEQAGAAWVSVRVKDEAAQLSSDWSGMLQLDAIVDWPMPLRAAKTGALLWMIRVRVRVEAAAFVLSVEAEPADMPPPVRIENRCALSKLRYAQHGVERWASLAVSESIVSDRAEIAPSRSRSRPSPSHGTRLR